MTAFGDLSFLLRTGFAFWTLVLCTAAITGVVLSVAVKRYRCIFLSLAALLPSYLLWQACYDLDLAVQHARLCIRLGGAPWLAWLAVLALLTLLSALPIRLCVLYAGRSITPLTIKRCADSMSCGICYWRENGHVIFANECMKRLCVSLTGEPLMNGEHFHAAVSGGIVPIGDGVWSFTFRDLTFQGGALHEMVASDVSELHEKAEALRRDNKALSGMREELRAYGLRIDDTVRRQEILQAKVNIHDEMNRLMLSTVAVDLENEAELRRNFSLWERNALQLCLEADERKDENAAAQLESMAQALGLRLVWREALSDTITAQRRELFFLAAQEAVANAVKHAGAGQLWITFTQTEDELLCTFENDGRVPKGAVRFTGGLANLSLLAAEQNARISAESGETFRLSLCFAKNP